MCKLLSLLLLAGLVAGAAAGADAGSIPTPVGPGLQFAVADFDGDLVPDLASVQIGRSDVSRTDYWIQLQISGAGRQTILVVGPSGGLQIAARDVNGDHALDLVLTTSWTGQPVAVLLNDGHGSFSKADPTAFFEALQEAGASWSSFPDATSDAVAVPPQSRGGICTGSTRPPRLGRQSDAIPAANLGFFLNLPLVSSLGRAPPSELPQR